MCFLTLKTLKTSFEVVRFDILKILRNVYRDPKEVKYFRDLKDLKPKTSFPTPQGP